MHTEKVLELTIYFGEYWLMMPFKTQTLFQGLNQCCALIDLHFTSLLKTIHIDPNLSINQEFLETT